MIRASSLLMIVLTLALGGAGATVGSVALRHATDTAQTASPTSPDCTVWRESPDDPTEPEACTMSPPWWTAWGTCPVTPIHGERWQAQAAQDKGLERIPWVRVESAAVGVVGHLFFGNRPLSIHGQFPDGSAAKVLWRFDRPVRSLAITATNLWSQDAPLILQEASTDPATSAQWPTNIAIPTPGCWRVDLHARDERGEVSASVVFAVVGEGGSEEANNA